MMRSILIRSCRYCQINRANAVISSKRCIVSTTSKYAKSVSINSNMTVHDLASKLKKKSKTILDLLDEYGYEVDHGVNTALDVDIAGAIADEFGYKVTNEKEKKEEKYNEDAGVSLPRPPVVTIMGHVDHGKTTLLDYLRKTQVAQNEAGGITQAISAFSVKVPGLSDSITFVDTPGHAAFNNMRERGAQVTDAVVLIIAADDGIMEQTVECIKHIKKADVPLIVAFNKMDKPKANTERIKKDLLTHGLQLKELGGDIDCVEISALKGINVDELLVLLNGLSKKYTFKASYNGPAQIVVLETENSKQKGMMSMVLVKHGQLSKSQVLMTDTGFIKIRQILNPYGQSIEKANPSDPVTLMGWRSMPNPGDVAIEVKNEAEARALLKARSLKEKPEKVVAHKPSARLVGKKQLTQERKGGRNKRIPLRVTLRAEAATGKVQQEEKPKTLDLIIKADVSGSLEALVNILSRYHSTDITLNLLHAGVGSVNENDLKMLQTSEDSIVYAFNVDVTKNILTQAEQLDVHVKQFDIIYKLLDDLKEKLENTLPMRNEEHIIGEAEVLKVFKLTGSRKNVAAGCRVKEGFLDNSDPGHLWRVLRDHQPVYEAGIKSLKRGKEDVALAKNMTECGVTLDNFEDYQEGDKILCVRIDKIKQVVDWKL